ncbi:hypothetical protein PPERSA_07899 [Pseudocohnilembus persalinus]|uniref:Uncharacterized protein n=1 Tax=Pseudocohnilembus persalinus TaxID=266149 RepID=A0A0V0QW94_PSEPJ|nr:hypothetical protein PPERSA_07899 [Pseudocohnilembus persalinus]|eukprot:KRX06665.1 hypothetical protein PPERSA_07899 [Pseudocohnilembus persalinus]
MSKKAMLVSEKIYYIQDISPKGILAREFPDLNSKIIQKQDGKKLGTKGQSNIYEASQKFELNIQKTEIEQFHQNKKIEIPFNEIQIVFYFINDIKGWIFDTHLSNFQKIVKEITEDQFLNQKNNVQNMEQKNKHQQKSVCKATTVSFYITNCPNCQTSIQIRQNQINCGIFRCGTYKSNNRQIPSHLPKSQCEILVTKKLIYGCGKPFKVQKNRDNGNIEAKKCDYI